MKAAIIGSGNVAEAFARALRGAGVEVTGVYARNGERGRSVAALAGCGYFDLSAEISDADICIAAVSDRAVGEVLERAAIDPRTTVVHVAGGCALEAIPEVYAKRGVVYPLQTFTSGREVDFSQVPFFIEGSDAATTLFLKDFAGRLSPKVYDADSRQRARIHITGVFVCNFVNAMYCAGNALAAGAGMPFEVLKPLIAETAQKALECSDPRRIQTGPAVRGDGVTLERHRAILASEIADEELKKIYETLSEYITKYGKEL